MAVMIPSCGPAPTESRGEPHIYYLLKEQLADDFTVIHSLPWLSTAAREIVGVKSVTGEIDFLILHPVLGVLALEVKGGAHKIEGLAFVHVKSGTATRPVEQVRKSIHGLARWLGVKPALRFKIGYALAFPHSDFQGQIISTALTDVTVEPRSTIVIDKRETQVIGRRIVEIMRYWKQALSNPSLGHERMKALVDSLCPSFDGTPTWGNRVVWDREVWLRLTPEQSTVVNDVVAGRRLVVTGWPGTGKTLILIECARRLLQQGRSVLVLTFNALLAKHIQEQIGRNSLLMVRTWHSFCGLSADSRSRAMIEVDRDWLDHRCLDDLSQGEQRGAVREFDAVLVDEAQAFRTEWFAWISKWHSDRQLLAFCDETQVFPFEDGRIPLEKLCKEVGIRRPFELTSVLRSPTAVFERLKQVRKPDVQLHTPRELEVDALEELLVAGMDEALNETLYRLSDSGVLSSDVVVLTKFGMSQKAKSDLPVLCDTVSRFRGLESPVVIILNAEQMNDTELFCAYSRSTSLCIALYDAELLGARGADSQLQSIVLSMPGNVDVAERAWRSVYAGDMIKRSLNVDWLNLRSVELGWIPEWQSWAVTSRDTLSPYWISFLASDYSWPIHFWNRRDLRNVKYCSPVQSISTDSCGGLQLALLVCDSCAFLTPQKLDPRTTEDIWICTVCDQNSAEWPDSPDDEIINRIRLLDALVSIDNPKRMSAKDRKSLPLLLAAGMSMRFAERTVMPHPVGIDKITSGRVSYQAALGFVYALINLLPKGDRFEAARMASDLFSRYSVPSGLTLQKWKSDFALACSVALKYGDLHKLEKGIYMPRDSVACFTAEPL